MTAGEAEAARAACLAAFDDRTAARRALLAQRLAESRAEAARLGGLLASEAQHLGPEELARLREEEAAAAFRLKVVERRAQELGPHAAARRRELEAKLDADRRLVAALAAGG